MKRCLLGLFSLLTIVGNGWAQEYPTRPVRLIVPYTPGGPADVVARVLGRKLGAALGQSVLVENRGGASGVIGTEMVAKSPADGYTLLFGTIQTHGVNPSLIRKLPYDPLKDFSAIAPATTFPFVLVVPPALPAQSLADLIRLARSQPGRLNYASAGSGTGTHLAAELFKSLAKVDIAHVPYKGGGEALTDVLADRVQLTFTGIPAALAHIRAGRLRPLAVTGTGQLADLPNVPTVAETLPGFEVSSWNGFFSAAGTPAQVVAKLNREIATILRQGEVNEQLGALGAQAVLASPEQFASYVQSEVAKWKGVIAAAGIKPEGE
jgi:tripartite-type tricarboxylate transporter receptor subunit TctC